MCSAENINAVILLPNVKQTILEFLSKIIRYKLITDVGIENKLFSFGFWVKEHNFFLENQGERYNLNKSFRIDRSAMAAKYQP